MRSITRHEGKRVHTVFSLDPEPIDAFQALLEALTVVRAPEPVTPAGRVLRDVWDEARELDEAEIAALVEKPQAEPEHNMNHRGASDMVARERDLAELNEREAMLQCGISREPDLLRGFPANFKVEQKWRAPGIRQDVVTKRFKRFGIKN